MHRYTATLAHEPDNLWRWTGDAHHVHHAAKEAAHAAFLEVYQEEPEDVYPLDMDVAHAETPDKPIATIRVSQVTTLAAETVKLLMRPSIRGG